MNIRRRTPMALLMALSVTACERPLPDPGSPEYTEVVAAFYRGLAAAQTGESNLAVAAFERVIELAPGEPAGWANLGLVALQQRALESAAERLQQARQLAPENSSIHFASALVEREGGRPESVAEHLRRAVSIDPANVRARFLLAQILAEQNGPDQVREAMELVGQILAVDPDNLVALLERARLAARLNDREGLRETLNRIATRAERMSVTVTDELDEVRAASAAGEFVSAATQIAFVEAELQPAPGFLDDRDALVTSPSRVEAFFSQFVRLPIPTVRSAAPDLALAFAPETLTVGIDPIALVDVAWLREDVPLALLAVGRDGAWVSTEPGQSTVVPFPAGVGRNEPSRAAVAPLDYNYDFLMDLVVAGGGGMRVLRQDENGSFTDETRTAVRPAVARASYAGAWAADLDMEGDLDVVLATIDGPPTVLRNRGDGTFEAYSEFSNTTRVRDFVWADLDADGDPDATFLDADGGLNVFLNGRASVPPFEPVRLPDTLQVVEAVAAADLNQDAVLDLILLRPDGALMRLSRAGDGWEAEELARWSGFTPAGAMSTRLLVADLDNNGNVDLIAATPTVSQIWLGSTSGLTSHATLDLQVTSFGDLSGDGRMDLLGMTPDGQPRLLVNQGTAEYYSANIHTRAAQTTGDRRINSFGIGGEVEVRAGLLYQKQPINNPMVHFGLGEQRLVDVARIIWPNGTVQAEFSLPATSEAIMTRQRLKGSCPWVFAYDGTEMQFVTDFLWRTALGLRINAQGAAMVIHSEDWIKIRGDQLAPRDGHYDIRITAELWETHFFDHVALMVVDHPEDTEVFVDERFTLPAPEQAIRAMQALQPVLWARDDAGRDVTDLISVRDGRFLDTFTLGQYQGLALEHYVEVALGDDVPSEGPVWLVANGWVYPTDASINVAVGQRALQGPRGVQLEVLDGEGGWVVVEPDLGFPSGKTKTMLIDLTNVFQPTAERRVRLRTNMEIYWDHIAWAVGEPDAPVNVRRILPSTAELRYRGFSEVAQIDRSAPEIPVYDRVGTTVPQWRDLVGFHTRFGDVRALNEAVDDRYTIMNAGDEFVLRFEAPPDPAEGWVRDFVLVGDGWVKDGDYNTGFSTTVLPLPYHALADYSRPPGPLQEDPAYRQHPEDWRDFHTRYVTPRVFQRVLVPERQR